MPRVTTAEDAGGYPHYLEGGTTAVREFVIEAGRLVPNGFRFRIVHGSWLVEWTY